MVLFMLQITNTKLKLRNQQIKIGVEGAVDINGLKPKDPSKHVLSVISYGDMRVSVILKHL